MKRPRFLPDNFTLLLVTTVVIASFFPCTGQVAVGFDWLTIFMIGLLFFMHGAKLSREQAIAGLMHWKLHLLVLALTFALFPILGLVLKPALLWMVTPDLYLGVLYLCVLPSTVQSSIAFTSVARGNVPAAICAASGSNLLGIFITPLLVNVMVVTHGGTHASGSAILSIIYQLLLPFIAGQIARRWIADWIERYKVILKMVDQSSILLIIYVAFSEAVGQGLWSKLPFVTLIGIVAVSAILLGVMMTISVFISRRMGFSTEDEITILFCGSKKSLASGVPMAKVLFSAQTVGVILLPIMIFHQFQLMVCAILAQRYARRNGGAAAPPSAMSAAQAVVD